MKTLKYILAFLILAVSFLLGQYVSAEIPQKPMAKPVLYTGAFYNHKTVFEDTLLDLARKFNLGFVEMVAANPHLDPWVPGEGQDVLIPALHILPDVPHRGVVVNVGDMRLYSFDERGLLRASYPIGVGREGLNTPLGGTFVRKKVEGPWWRPTQRMLSEDPTLSRVVKQGPDNPLGTHILYLGWPTYAIHGTNKPWGIGRRVSSGCIRMYPEDIPVLYDMVDVKEVVTVVDQRYKAAWISGDLYLEVHPSKEQSVQLEFEENQEYDFPQGLMAYLVEKAGAASDRIIWSRVEDVVLHHAGYPVRVTAREGEEIVLDSSLLSAEDEGRVEDGESRFRVKFRQLDYND